MEPQNFLTSELQQAMKSGSESAVKLVYLRYQKAMLKTLQDFQPCRKTCAHVDLTLLKKRAERLSTQTENYITTVEVLPMERIKVLFGESRTLFRDIAQLCPNCRETIRQTILVNFQAFR